MISNRETDIIIKYISHTATEQECEELISWLEESEENKRFFADLSAEFASHEYSKVAYDDEATEGMLSRLNARIDTDDRRTSLFKRNLTKFIPWGIAVASLVLCVLMYKPWADTHSDKLTDVKKVLPYSNTNSTASVKQVLLEDRTSVFLSSGARISYDVSGSERLVKLDGEAYFNVAKDTLRPFIVDVGNMKIRVTGTAFSARSASEFTNSEVILEKGSVRLQTPDGINLVSMKPNQKATFNQRDQDISIEEVYAFPYIQEKYSLVSLSEANIEEIIACVENTFSVRIRCEVKNADKKYNLNFLRSDSIDDVVKLVEVLTGEEISIQSNK